MTENNLTRDHAGLTDTFAARRYFRKFDRITRHLVRVAIEMEATGQLDPAGIHLHNALWASVMSGAAGSPMPWWWDS